MCAYAQLPVITRQVRVSWFPRFVRFQSRTRPEIHIACAAKLLSSTLSVQRIKYTIRTADHAAQIFFELSV